MKKLEDMSVQELLNEMVNTHKKTKFQPEKFKTDEQGTILLNPNNSNDKEWMDSTEDDLL